MTDRFSQADVEAALADGRRYVAEHWGWFLTLGLLFIIGGILAIAFPLVSTIATKIALGWIFMIGGALLVVHAFSVSGWRGFLWSLLIGILYLVAGGWLAFFPFTGIITLTILLAAMFLAEGVLEVIMAFRVRPHEGWGWLLLSGLIAIAVGLLIGASLPSSAGWAIGLLTGINLISTGWGFVFISMAGRRAGQAGAVTA
ncbi:MAG TPA: HdeD family acid-resistance protein [Hyphomicrobiaceae bacterium]|nr:HdeD family acid-resistance protein [Hyphomicrobiaceae bacterium]